MELKIQIYCHFLFIHANKYLSTNYLFSLLIAKLYYYSTVNRAPSWINPLKNSSKAIFEINLIIEIIYLNINSKFMIFFLNCIERTEDIRKLAAAN